MELATHHDGTLEVAVPVVVVVAVGVEVATEVVVLVVVSVGVEVAVPVSTPVPVFVVVLVAIAVLGSTSTHAAFGEHVAGSSPAPQPKVVIAMMAVSPRALERAFVFVFVIFVPSFQGGFVRCQRSICGHRARSSL
jgi:hypothetical protein